MSEALGAVTLLALANGYIIIVIIIIIIIVIIIIIIKLFYFKEQVML